jgi:YegS/Rv2252/BmrU family lipid kinase
MHSPEVAVIVNPVAGRGAWERAHRFIVDLLRGAGTAPVARIAAGPGQAETHAEEVARAGCDIVVAAGGDGTIHEVVNGLMRGRPDRPPALAVVPVGTANILARALRLPRDPAAAARLVMTGTRLRMDLGRANERYFASVAGTGFDAEVARIAAQWPRWIGGKVRHVAAGVLRLSTYRAPSAEIRIDGRSRVEPLFLLAAANTGWYGGGIHIAPHARLDDGRLEVVYIRSVSAIQAVRLFVRSLSGRHLRDPRVESAGAQTVHVTSEIPLPVHADGEHIGTTPVTFQCIPGAFEVLVPAVTRSGAS